MPIDDGVEFTGSGDCENTGIAVGIAYLFGLEREIQLYFRFVGRHLGVLVPVYVDECQH